MQEAMGAGAGWLCRERVWRAMGSGRCAGGWVDGVVDAWGGTLGAAAGIVNAAGVTLGAAVGITLRAGDGVGFLPGAGSAGRGSS